MKTVVYVITFLFFAFSAYSFAEIVKVSDKEYKETTSFNSSETVDVTSARSAMKKEKQYMAQDKKEAERIASYYNSLESNHMNIIESYQAMLDKGMAIGVNWQDFEVIKQDVNWTNFPSSNTSSTNWTDTNNP